MDHKYNWKITLNSIYKSSVDASIHPFQLATARQQSTHLRHISFPFQHHPVFPIPHWNTRPHQSYPKHLSLILLLLLSFVNLFFSVVIVHPPISATCTCWVPWKRTHSSGSGRLSRFLLFKFPSARRFDITQESCSGWALRGFAMWRGFVIHIERECPWNPFFRGKPAALELKHLDVFWFFIVNDDFLAFDEFDDVQDDRLV